LKDTATDFAGCGELRSHPRPRRAQAAWISSGALWATKMLSPVRVFESAKAAMVFLAQRRVGSTVQGLCPEARPAKRSKASHFGVWCRFVHAEGLLEPLLQEGGAPQRSHGSERKSML